MKKITRYTLLGITSILLLSTIGYSAFIISQIKDESSVVIDNTYSVTFHYRDFDSGNIITKTITNIEEDSYFDLPVLEYENLVFSGWSLYESRSNALTTYNTSIKTLKEQYSDLNLTNNNLNLYSVINNIGKEEVLLEITDNTSNLLTYFMKTKASMFSLFNIRYVYPSTFVNITINDIIYDINDEIDLTPYGGTTLSVLVTKTE